MKPYKGYCIVIILFTLLASPWLDKGLISIDAHGILNSAETAINEGIYNPSRPPGHPSYELFTLYPIGIVYKLFTDEPLSPFLYNVIQFLSSLACCVLLYRILIELKKSVTVASLGSLILMLLPSFYRNSIDGDEFNQALLGFLIAILLLLRCITHEERSIEKALIISSLCLAISTGFRQESIVTFLIFPLFFWIHPRYKVIDYLKWTPWQFICGFFVWLPVLIQNGFQLPAPMPIPENDALRNFSYKILVGSYKILFKGFTPAILLLLFFGALKYIKPILKTYRKTTLDTFILTTTGLIGIAYILLFYSYPYKADFLHPVFPLIIICFVHYTARYWTYALAAVSAISFFVSIEIAHGRKIGAPYISYGHGIHIIMGKAYFQKDNLLSNFQNLPNGKNVFIANLRNWDLEYLQKNNHINMQRSTEYLYTWEFESSSKMITERTLLEREALLMKMVDNGYNIYIEKELFHTFFYRYETNKILENTEIKNGVVYHLL